jgi:hypothetical protein
MNRQLSGELPVDPFNWRVISSAVDERAATMAILYGNDVAVRNARTSPDRGYPPGSVLAVATWRRQDDEHWFGARIPGGLRSIEVVTVRADGSSDSYDEYRGALLTRAATTEAGRARTRIDQILGQPAAIMPGPAETDRAR